MKTNLTECIGPGVMIHLPCERGEQSRAWPEQGFCACSFPEMNVIPFPDHKGYFSYWSKAIRNVSNIIYIDTTNKYDKKKHNMKKEIIRELILTKQKDTKAL